jgi:DNA-binding MarR family transcriptional regulator
VDKPVDRIRAFNRFYTSQLGVVNKHILQSEFSLSEARILYEINTMTECSARKIMKVMDIDEGYLSRIIESFIGKGLVAKRQSDRDKRLNLITPTSKGVTAFRKINLASSKAIRAMIKDISDKDLQLMLLMMEGIQNIITKTHGSNTR